eukprot:9640835-Heterocapsa_arctica.AAC.1
MHSADSGVPSNFVSAIGWSRAAAVTILCSRCSIWLDLLCLCCKHVIIPSVWDDNVFEPQTYD